MKPVNFDSGTCNPISSNCVIWQGPNIDCINLCNGDTVSDVVYKLATELCTIMDTLNVTSYDLSCLNITACGPSDFTALIQFLIEKICELEGITPVTAKSGGGCPTDCVVTVAKCFQTAGLTMNLVDYVNMIASRICTIADSIDTINLTLSNHETRLDVIETTYCKDCNFTIPSVSFTCPSLTGAGVANGSAVQTAVSNFFTNVWCTFFTKLTASTLNGTDLSVLTASLNPTTCTLASINSGLSLSLPSSNDLPTTLSNIWAILCKLKTPVTLTAQNTPTIVTTVTGGPAYTISSKIVDTGWKPLKGFTFLNTYPAAYRPRVRRIGNVLHFAGTAVVPMGDAGNGESGNVVTQDSVLGAYENLQYGKTLNSALAPTQTDACQIYVGTAGNATPWTNPPASQYGSFLYFNSGNGVLPTGILNAGEVIDSDTYRLPGGLNILERSVLVNNAGGGRHVEMNTIVRIQLIPSGSDLKLQMVAATNREAYHPNSGIVYSSGLRSMISRAVSGQRVPFIDGTKPGFQSGGSATGAYNMQGDSTNTHSDGNGTAYGSDAVWGHNQDAGDALQLGGFLFSLDGLTAFVDPCGTNVVASASCA